MSGKTKTGSCRNVAKAKKKRIIDKTVVKLIKDQVRERDNFTCQRCGKKVAGRNCQVSHVVPESADRTLRYDMMNMKILCLRDHIYWWHKHPLEAAEWFREKFPARYEYLKGRMLAAPAPKPKYLEDLDNATYARIREGLRNEP